LGSFDGHPLHYGWPSALRAFVFFVLREANP
jgi:hypothetical protein